jgi:RHS repeat-associated protein
MLGRMIGSWHGFSCVLGVVLSGRAASALALLIWSIAGCSDAEPRDGELGRSVAALVANANPRSLATGFTNACAIVDTGGVKCWGYNSYGQLGLGDKTHRGDNSGEMGDSLPFVNLGTGRLAVQITAGDYHKCALLDNGAVKCWGSNSSGGLGLGDTNNRGDNSGEMGDALPALDLGSGRTALSIHAMAAATCALLDNQQVKCWGANNSGQLGLGDTNNRGDNPGEMGDTLPVINFGTGRTVKSLATGATHSCVVLDNDKVKCWGSGSDGRLGMGDTINRGDGANEMGDSLPYVSLGTSRTAKAVMAARTHSCAILDNNALKCWGHNSTGQLGLGDTASRGDNSGEMGDSLPGVNVSNTYYPVAVSGGMGATCVILNTGSVKCWGDNVSGQLGQGDTVTRGDNSGEMGSSLPAVSLGTGRTAIAIGVGASFVCVVLDNKQIKCWGNNGLGQLGLGDTARRGDQTGEMGDSLPTVNLGCNDGNACNGVETTSGSTCIAGTPIALPDDGNACTTTVCAPATGTVSFKPVVAGTSCGSGQTCDAHGTCELPPPTLSAPVPDSTTASTLGDSVAFIYDGPGAIQTGADVEYIEGGRPGQISGFAHAVDGTPLSNVRITTPQVAEYGETLTRSDGRFDLVVRGGTTVVLRLEKTGYLPLERRVEIGWDESAFMDDVTMLQPATGSPATFGSGAPAQTITGSCSSDQAGCGTSYQRTPVVFIPSGTTSGSIGNTTLRITEFTAGPTGRSAMPGELPPTTAFTYAVDLSIDGSTGTTTFNKGSAPAELPVYLDDFLNLGANGTKIGRVVPAAYYDKDKHAWVSEPNGRVIKITSVTGGVAVVDSGTANLSLSTEERTMLGQKYAAGKTLWRIPVKHFSAWDFNLPLGPPDCEGTVCPGPTGNESPPDGCNSSCCMTGYQGSIIDCEAQGLGEAIDVPGTAFQLNYRSRRMPGYRGRAQIPLNLTGAQVHSKLLSVDVEVDIAGRRFKQSVPKPPPNTTTMFTWDGYDGFEQPVYGARKAKVTIESKYQAEYYEGVDDTAIDAARFAFGRFSPTAGTDVASGRQVNTVSYPITFSVDLPGLTPLDGWALGGWTLSNHHVYNVEANEVLLGSGGIIDTSASFPVVRVIAGNGNGVDPNYSTYKTNVDALQTPLGMTYIASNTRTGGVAVGANGDVYLADGGHKVVRRIRFSDNVIEEFAGGFTSGVARDACGYPYNDSGSGDGTPATSAALNQPNDVAIGPDGSIYILERTADLVRRVTPDGIIRTFAGVRKAPCSNSGSYAGTSAEGAVATATSLEDPEAIDVGPDGSVFIVDDSSTRIRRIDPGGKIWTVAGGGSDTNGHGKLATTVALSNLKDVAVGPDGTIYIAEGYELASVTPDGLYRRLTKYPFSAATGIVEGVNISTQSVDVNLETVATDRFGNLFYNDDEWQRQPSFARRSIRRVGPTGIVTTLANSPLTGSPVDGGAALGNMPYGIGQRVATSPNGDTILLASNRIYRVQDPLQKGLEYCADPAAAHLVPSGDEGYCFDVSGRHLSTIDLRSLAKIFTFAYSNGKLVSVTDRSGNPTTVTHGSGQIDVTSPYGQVTRVSVGGNGYATEISQLPGVSAYEYLSEIDDAGMLNAFTNKRGKRFEFYYDAEGGHLTDDVSPVGTQSFFRNLLADGYRVDRWSPMGRLTTHQVRQDLQGVTTQLVTQPDGSTRLVTSTPRAVSIVEDGTTTTRTREADPRFGFESPYVSLETVKLPSGLTKTTSQTRMGEFSGSLLTKETTVMTVGSRSWDTVYTPATRTTTTTSDTGREMTVILDAKGRLSERKLTGVLPTTYAYYPDPDGRLMSVTQGSRDVQYAYETASGLGKGYVKTVTNAVGEQTSFVRNVLGNVTSETANYLGTPSATTALGWDNGDRLFSVKAPGKTYQHKFGYNDLDQVAWYWPPNSSTYDDQYAYNADRQMVTEKYRGITKTYDSYGRPDVTSFLQHAETTSTAAVDVDYYANSDAATGAVAGRPMSIKGPYGVDLAFTYDGSLLKKESWSWLTGSITKTASVTRTYDTSFLNTLLTITNPDASSIVAFYKYDGDNLVSCATTASSSQCPPASGYGMQVVRAVTAEGRHRVTTTIGNVTQVINYNAYGEIADQSATFSGTPIVSIDYEPDGAARDDLGRITQMMVSRDSSDATFSSVQTINYDYDGLGRLTDADVVGGNEEHFDYDLNGNRNGYTSSSPPVAIAPADVTIDTDATDRDRLYKYGGTTFAFTSIGQVKSKTDTTGTTSYRYDGRGNLVLVTKPDGYVYKYLVDGKNRRVAKLEGASEATATMSRRWVYGEGLMPIAEYDGSNDSLIFQFVYVTNSRVPDYVFNAVELKTYRLITDHLGSVRYVVHVDSGSVALRAEYAAFGARTLVSSSGSRWRRMPFGFAGGFYDYDTDIVRFGARDYDANTGRWMSTDPIRFAGGQSNLYAYVNNDPVNNTDPTGLILGRDGSSECVSDCVASQAEFWTAVALLAPVCESVSGAGAVGAGIGILWGLCNEACYQLENPQIEYGLDEAPWGPIDDSHGAGGTW